MAIGCIDASGKKRGFPGDTCPAGWKPSAGAGTPAGEVNVPGAPVPATGVERPIRVPGLTQYPTRPDQYVQIGDRVYGSSPRQDYSYYENADQMETQSWSSLPQAYKDVVTWYAEQMGHGKTATGLWNDALAATKQNTEEGHTTYDKSPFGWITEYAGSLGIHTRTGGNGPGGNGSSGGSSGSGAAAPVAAGADSMRRMMDSLANDLIGRTLSEKEFRQYYRAYKGDFGGNPALDEQQHGTNALKANDDYQEYQVAEKFATAMQSVLRGAA